METISIVGGGIAGLALAAGLDSSRFQVRVYEKRPELPAVGTALGMWPNAQRALARLGILEEARAVSPVLGSGSVLQQARFSCPARTFSFYATLTSAPSSVDPG